MRSRAGLIAIVAVCIVAVAIVNIRRDHSHAARPAPVVIVTPSQCPASKGEYVTEDFGITIGGFAIRPVRAVADRCSDATGTRYPSTVKVIDDDDDSRVIANLIRPDQNLHIYAMVVTDLTVTVTFTDWAGGRLGTMDRQSFTSTDGTTYRPGVRTVLYRACTPSQLGLSAVAAIAPDLAVLRVRNKSTLGCTLEGYPTAAGAPGDSTVARTEFSDAGSSAAGSSVFSGTAPPIVLLEPGQVATAAVSSADEAPDGGAILCTSLTKLVVGLASGAPLGTVPVSVRVCDFQVHPWLPGQRS